MVSGFGYSGETSTHPPVNRGAARQMFGSGSLRQWGSGSSMLESTPDPNYNHNQETKNDIGHDENNEKKHTGMLEPCTMTIMLLECWELLMFYL